MTHFHAGTRSVAIKGRMPPFGGTTLPGSGRLAEASASLAMQFALVSTLPSRVFLLRSQSAAAPASALTCGIAVALTIQHGRLSAGFATIGTKKPPSASRGDVALMRPVSLPKAASPLGNHLAREGRLARAMAPLLMLEWVSLLQLANARKNSISLEISRRSSPHHLSKQPSGAVHG